MCKVWRQGGGGDPLLGVGGRGVVLPCDDGEAGLGSWCRG